MWYLCLLVIVLGENTLQNWKKIKIGGLPNSKQHPYNHAKSYIKMWKKNSKPITIETSIGNFETLQPL
jgi:hypothetical protein